MKEIKICIGSACHLKGSYDVIEVLTRLIKDNNLEDKVMLCAAFCLGNCTEAVSVKRWDDVVLSVSKENVYDFFENDIKSFL
jgi:NADH:ubiquinone oxidoreductase subunit E